VGSPVATEDQFQTRHSIRPHCVWPDFVTTGTPPFKNTQSAGYLLESASAYLEHPELCSFQPQRRWFVEGINATVGKWVAKRTLSLGRKRTRWIPGCCERIVRFNDLIVAGTRCQHEKCQLRTDALLGMGGGLGYSPSSGVGRQSKLAKQRCPTHPRAGSAARSLLI
jgi:hypothetical protein